VSGEFEKCDVFFADAVKDANGADFSVSQSEDIASGPAELALEGLYTLDRSVEMLFEKPLENVHASRR
jgi:hypothetical protein